MDAFEPKLHCPVQPGKYVVESTSVDVGSFAILPIDGYIWVTTLKGFSGEGKSKKQIMCLKIDVLISKPKEARRG